jgi:hypothetical protein
MAAVLSEYEYELEALPELEATHETGVHAELESSRFFDALATLARRTAGSSSAASLQRRLAFGAARQALGRGLPALRTGTSCSAATRLRDGSSPCQCTIAPSEGEISPIRRIYPDAMMEHLGHAAAETHSEAEAEALVGAMVPLAARLVPRAAADLTRATPGLACGLAGVVRTLHRRPSTRPLVRTVPAIVRSTATAIAQQASRGKAVTPQAVVRTLAQQTARILGNPRQAAQAFRRSQQLDRQFHRVNGSGVPACPNCGYAATGKK